MTNLTKLAQRRRGTRGLSRRLLSGASLAAVLACGISSAAHAEDRNWDANITAIGSGGSGTWDLSGLNWSPNSDGVSGPYDRPWDNGAPDNAIFGGTAGTVTLGVPVTVGNITFSSAGYILSGDRLTLGGATSTITNAGDATIDSVIAGSSGLTKAGAGRLFVNGVNSFAGDIRLNAGSFYASTDAALGAAGNNIFTAAGSTVRLAIRGAATSRTVTIGDGGTLVLDGSGVGSARITGNGGVRIDPSNNVATIVRLTNDANDYTGMTVFSGCNGVCSAYFSSIADLGVASSLGAPTTIANGTIVFNQQSQYSDSVVYTGDGDSSNRNWDINGDAAQIRNQGTGTLRITGNVDISSSGTFNAETANFELLGVLSGGSFGFGAAAGRSITLGGANIFAGNAAIGGLVRASVLADIGTVSSFGVGSTITLNAGMLSYTGGGAASNRLWGVVGASSILNDGTGALDLSGGASFTPGGVVDSLTLGGGFAGVNNYSGIISGAGDLIGNGSGTWILSGANSFTGAVRMNAGTLRAGHASAFGAANGLVVNGGTLDLNGYDLTASSLTGTGGTVDLGSATLTVNAANNQSYAGGIAGSGGIRKAGAGTLTLTGTSSYVGATTIAGGKLALDFSGAGGPVSDIISTSSSLVLSGGTIEVLGAAGEANSQSFNGVTVNAGSNTVRAVNGAGGSVTLNLGAISRTGGLVNFVLPGGGAITTANADGTLGGWATINASDYAKVVGGVILALDDSDYSNKDDAGTWATNDIVSDTGNAPNTPFFGTVASNIQLGGLRYSAAAGSTVTIGAANTLGVDGTIIVAPGTLTANQTITGGSLTGGANGGTLGVQQNGGGTFTIASSIVDNGGATAVSKGGAGLLVLSGANSYTGATILAGGTLRFSSIANGGVASGIGASAANASNLVIEAGNLQYTGATASTDRGFTLVDGGTARTIDVTQAGTNLTFTGQVTSPDQAGFTKAGAGTLTLANGANNYVGATIIGGGTLSVNALADGGTASGIGAADSASTNLVLRDGGRLQYTGGNVSIDRGFMLNSGIGRIDVAQASTTLTISGPAVGGGSFHKDGAGTLVLGGANAGFSGSTVVNAGTLRAGSAQAFGPGSGAYLTVNSGATLDLGGFNISTAAVAGGGLINLGARTLTTAGGQASFTGIITGTGGFTRGAGSYTQTISGCNNSYTGVTTVNGSLAVDCIANGGLASGIGASGAASANLVFGGGTLSYTGTDAVTNRGFTLTGNGVLNVTDPAATLEFQGVVAGGGALFKDGDGTLTLSGANIYTGTTRVSGGTLRAGSTQAFGTAGPMILNNAAGVVLDLAGYNTSVSYLELGGTAGGNVNLNGATLTIAAGNNSATSYFGGAITGAGNLVKNGTGTQRLTGCDSDYSGTTTVNGGVLVVSCLVDGGQASSMGTSSAAASNLVLNGGTLRYAGTGGSTNRQFMLGASGNNGLDASGTGAINFTANGPLTFTSPNSAQTLTLTGTNSGDNILAAQIINNGSGRTSLTKTGVGTWILTNPDSNYTGITTISGGVLGVDKLTDGGLASSLGASSAAASNLIIGNGSTLRYTGAGDSTNRLFTLSSGVTFIESSGTGAIVFTDTGPVTLQGNNQARTIALGGTNTGNNTLAGSIGNAGTGVTILAKNDSGTWVLTGNNSYSGSTNINAGTLFIGNGGTTGSVASATINNFGALGFNRSDSMTYAGAIVGTGSVRQAGTGTTILTGANLYTGGTTVSTGTLQLGNGGATGSLVGDVANDGIFTFNRNNVYNFAGLISGTGEVRQIGSGTTILTADHSYTGGSRISAGTLQIGNGGATGSILGDVANNGTLAFNRSNALSFGGVISGNGALRKLGAGTLTLTANNSYVGATTVEAGTLVINGDQSAATGLTTVNNGATLGGSGTIGGDVLVANGGNLNPGNSPGTLTIAGSLGLSGGSILNYEFGQANVVGGPLNDLIEVGGDLILDGTINVTVPTAGAFDAGVYRVISYGGSLVDSGLVLGAMPAGSDVAVQTSVAGQVNLVNSTGLALSFWDGVAGPKLNGQVDGGNGSWHLGGADNNWTDAAGGVNAAYADGTYAIFSGAAGTVSVDNSLGAVSALGMQFASDGYVINGNTLALVGPQSVIRVGDGTAVGAGFTATIASRLAGASQLVKTDTGTLVLSGANSYTGGTLIDEGTLRISSDANLGDAAGRITIRNGTLHAAAGMTTMRGVTLTGAATLSAEPGSALFMTGAIDGAGSLTTAGGLVTLAGDNSYTGGTTIRSGTLQIGAGTTTGSIIGDVLNNGALVFSRTNDLVYGGAISGSGQLQQIGGGTLTLTGTSSYAGATTINAGKIMLQAGGQINGTSNLTVNNGEMIVDGAGARLVAGPVVSVVATGASGNAALTVRNGGSASFADFSMATGTNSNATLTIAGAGSQVTQAGTARFGLIGNATVDILGGGRMASSGPIAYVGGQLSSNSRGFVTVSGAGSEWAVANALHARRGTITVADGGLVTAGSAIIGQHLGIGLNAPSANLIVMGAGSRFETSGTLAITNSAANGTTGSITIGDGGVVRVGGGTLAMGPGNAVLYIGDFQSLPAGKRAGILDAAELTFAAATNMVNFNHIDSDYVFATRMSGAGEIISSRGTTILTADNAHSGQTHINGGMIIVNGNQSAATGRISVMAGGALGGRGVIGGDVEVFGRIAPGDLGEAPGTLTINGDLFTSFNASLDYNFGQANVVGGAYNDLINVGGNLTLDGTLNVTVSPGGSFDPGVYRVINYAGTLTDNGLSVDPAYYLQTSVANQVNLVNTTGLTMRFWDGGAGAKNDGRITGGDGLWQNSGGNDNWTEYDGSANAPFTDDAFAVFSGLGGTVTVDSSLGPVTASGMQFASDGYIISGADLALVAPDAIIRVGDGTAGGAAYTATIASNLTAIGNLTKSDLGTLVLTGAGSVTGDVGVRGGELRLTDGGTMTSGNGIVGIEAGDEAIMTVAGGNGSGAASTWTVGGDLTVGYDGKGTLNIVDGGKVISNTGLVGANDGAGQIRVTGAGSSWANSGRISVGLFGTGTLRIENGATVTSNDGIVGGSAQGDAVISGPGTSWTNTQQLNVGSFGAGTMRIENGASVASNQGYIGANDTGSVTVTGSGSNWLVTNFSMTVGNAGNGSLSIEDGGRVRGEGGFELGNAAGSTGTVTLLGTPGRRGVLETSRIKAGLGTVNFTMDGGLLRATQDVADFFTGFGTRDLMLGVNGGIIDTDGHDIGIAPGFAGIGGLTKDGLGTLTLTGASSYSGATQVNAGTLLVNGDQSAATGLTTVASSATLGGNGIIGGDVNILDGATLAAGANGVGTLGIKGNLALSAGSFLDFAFGEAGIAGGALNDLVNVDGNLTLDGTINVTVPTGGSFGPGVYRVFNYGGALTDNGLALGTMPGGGMVSVQTSVAGQVNLVNTQGLTLSFWDGAVGPKNNGAINGGNGVWRIDGAANNWADMTGTVNADYAQDSFAVFSATAGTVTVDNSGGDVLASGMQFASDGYVITGDTLTLTGTRAIVQVGDGSIAGAGYTATIDAVLAGPAGLVKTDSGTLILTGTNSYTGGTRIEGGTLRIASDANLGGASGGLGLSGGTLHTTASFASARQIDLTGGGRFLTDAGTALTLTGSLGGAGALTKTGAGTLILGGTGSHSGGMTVAAGTLFVNGDHAGATGATVVASGATLGGTGVIGGDVAIGNGATLAPGADSVGTLTIGGHLSLVGGSRLAFELGEAGVAGGARNDLVNVGGNLTLDGTIDVAVPAGGVFDVGIYRLFNYGGALVDNGLELGTLPAGANVNVQTSIGGQVNLVNSTGLTLRFWDGAAGPKNDGAINGGTGVWQASAGNDHWTDASGALNAPYSDGAFAVFGGSAGTVTVDNALGAVSVAGMQFATDGYVIAGDDITLGAQQTVIRVGDGSALGAGFRTTINAALGGSAELVKTDAGTLILGGTNSYTGGTRINGGTVQIASDAGLGEAAGKVTLDGGSLATSADLTSNREIAVAGPGTIGVAADTRFSFGGQFTGTGMLTKAGAGSLLVTGNNDGFGGATNVAAGTLAVAGSLGGAVTVASGARLEGGGRVGSLINSGVVAPGNSIGTLTVTGDYEGRGGVLEMEVTLGGDSSASDRLVVGGATSGSTIVRVTNRGGAGAQTVEGIKIVDVAGASNGSFALDGDYLFDGEQAVVVGAYGYRLYKNGIATPQDGDWYLRSALLNPIDPEAPLYQPGVPVYEAYIGALQALNGLPTLQQRVGNRSWAGTPGADGPGIWGRFESQRLRPEAAFSTTGADRRTDGWQAQMGADMTLAKRSDGATLVGGINAHYGTADTAVASIFGNGAIDTKGYGVGATLSWYGPQGFYVDGQAKLSWFDSDLKSDVLGALVEGSKGKGHAFSVELGKRSPIGGNLTVTPQVQMSYGHVGFNGFTDPVDATVSADKGDSLKTRWGLSLDHQQSHGATGEGRSTHVYATVNLAYEWLGDARVLVSDTAIDSRGQRLTGELGLGGSYSWGGGRFTLYTEVAGDTGLADFGEGYSLKGTAGVRMRF